MLEIEPSTTGRPTGARTRVAAVVAAVALLTGAAGFVVGRAAASDSPRAAGAITESPSPSVPQTSPAEEGADRSPTTDVPVVPSADDSADTTPAVAPADGISSSEDAAMPSGAMGGQYVQNAYAEPQQELLAERTSPDGVTIRVHINRYEQSYSPYTGSEAIEGWAPAGWCFPTGDLRVAVSAPESTNITWGAWYDEPKDGLAITSFATGYVEGHPRFGVIAQVAGSVASVTMTTATGVTDTATPTNGVALLIIDGPIDDAFTVTVEQTDGSDATTGAAELTQPWTTLDYTSACEPPPPALPDAGEQPADPAAAEAAITDSWRVAHDGDNDTDVRLARIDDGAGIADAWQALGSGQYADAARTSTTTIRELVFTSPTEAWFRYDIETSITDFANRYGIARLGAGGTWQITRQTICQDIALAPGFGCSPSVDTLYPPSAANDPRYNGQYGGEVTDPPTD